jgi:hypothetical protein
MNLLNIGTLTRKSVYVSAGDSVLLSAPLAIQGVMFRLGVKYNSVSVAYISIYWNIADSIERQIQSRDNMNLDNIGWHVWCSVYDSFCNFNWYSLQDSVEGSVLSSVWRSVRLSVEGSVEGSVCVPVQDSMRSKYESR